MKHKNFFYVPITVYCDFECYLKKDINIVTNDFTIGMKSSFYMTQFEGTLFQDDLSKSKDVCHYMYSFFQVAFKVAVTAYWN